VRKFSVALWCALATAAPAFSASVLVLPFHNSSEYSDLNWVGESIADTLTTEFGAANEIVYDRNARSEALRRLTLRQGANYTKASLIRLGESLDADYICFGDFSVTLPSPGAALKDSILRISAQFIDLRKMHDGPDLSETGNLSELWRLEEHLAFESLHYLDPKLGLKVDDFLASQKAVRVDAAESYTRGLMSTSREQKQKWLLQAAALNPGFAGPAYELGRLYLDEKQYGQAITWLRKVPPADPRYARSRFRMGLAAYAAGDYGTAADVFRELVRTYQLNEVYNNLGVAEAAANQPAAVDDLRHALEGEPANQAYLFNLGLALLKRGDVTGAAAQLKAVVDQNAGDAEAADLLNRTQAGGATQVLVKPVMFRLKTNFNETAFRQLKAMIQTSQQ
jgi:tetratricopeptide (TPR) repeat protein